MSTGGPTIEQVMERLQEQARGYIADRACAFEVEESSFEGMPALRLRLKPTNAASHERVVIIPNDQQTAVLEAQDLALVQLSHMAVLCGLIQTTPTNITHHITLAGSDWTNSELQLDGHTLRGVHSLSLDMEAGKPHSIKLGFSRSKLYLDQHFLPRSMQLEVEGMAAVLTLLRRVTEAREAGFKDLKTGMDYAPLHSSEEEVELFREIYEALTLYEAVMEDPSVAENTSGEVH